MSELAFNLNGEPFELPTGASAWRVRRFKPKGAPEVVYGREGTPLVIPLDADMADLRREARAEGRYRLDAIDEHNRMIAGVPAAYVCIHPEDVAAPMALPPVPSLALEPVKPRELVLQGADAAVIEAMRVNSDLARSIVDKFPVFLEAGAVLLRAADGAGIPARAPRQLEVLDIDEIDEEAEEAPPPPTTPTPAPAPQGGWALIGRVLESLAPEIMRAVLAGKLQIPGGLGALLDPRRAHPSAATEPSTASAEPSEPAPGRRVPAPAKSLPAPSASSIASSGVPSSSRRTSASTSSTGPTPASATAMPGGTTIPATEPAATSVSSVPDGLPTLDAADVAHFGAVVAALTQREQVYARALAGELTPSELRAWVSELKELSAPDAVARIRAVLGMVEPPTNTTDLPGGAS